ncbi:SIMPL domain-containing protein [Rhodohalobacter halophilus]|uniref:SIMPL domain-containing protein n=1 Tax=Rhodohalobacter halophilus TaxID=1812810 RepID=UPI00083F7878|nr:SIMPL domain-containing protein [Rhodohalobacter halophilus]
MNDNSSVVQLTIGISIFLGLTALGYFITKAAVDFKSFDRSVTVKGLAEQEHIADIVIWPIQFTEASNSLDDVYESLDQSAERVREFLVSQGIADSEISFSTPLLTDRSAQRYGGNENFQYRYIASQTATIYSENVEGVRNMMSDLVELGKQGVTLSGNEYEVRPEYIFTRLNEIKPEMIEQATKEARQVAEKFAEDSNSKLGKIKSASQGQFSISDRDNNNPHIKKVRVVSTIVYYLSD